MAFASQSSFERRYKVQTIASWESSTDEKKSFESHHMIILPARAYEILLSNNCFAPYTFLITNESKPILQTYVGSFVFTANPSHAIIPNHILEALHFPSEIIVKYVSLPLATRIEFYPNTSTFTEQPKHKQYIREELCKLPCIAPSDTLHITINDETHTLTVINIEPNTSTNAVSLAANEYNVNIKILNNDDDHNDNDEGIEECPIIMSNITTNNGEEENTTRDIEEEDIFMDDDDGGWNDDDIDSLASDGQNIIPISRIIVRKSILRQEDDDDLVRDPNSTEDGNSRPLRPVRAKAQYRAWICEFCHATNNLLESITKRQHKCLQCAGKYRPGQRLIESQKEDEPFEEKQQWHVWYCACSKLNLMEWNNCDICRAQQPKEGIVSFWSTEEPIKTFKNMDLNYGRSYENNDGLNLHKNENIMIEKPKREREEYWGNVGYIGNIASSADYPAIAATKVNIRLFEIFGAPYQNSCIVSAKRPANEWIYDNKVGHCIMNVNKMMDAQIGRRCIALNEETGCIAIASAKHLFVIAPFGGYGFILKAHGVNSVTQIENARIRYVGDQIYVFDPKAYKIYVYFVNFSKGMIVFLQEIFESYFVDAQIKDIAVTQHLLIVLFDRWLGVYKLYPKLEWFHAVAFSRNKRNNVASIEMNAFDAYQDEDNKEEEEEKDLEIVERRKSIKHYAFINCENNIIAVHPANPTFDFLHIASNVKNGSSFCNSMKYGTFYINNEQDIIWQSSSYDLKAHKSRKVCSLEEDYFGWKEFEMIPMNVNDIAPFCIKDIDKFESVLYDETFGISGRLLVRCIVSQCDDVVFYQAFNWDEFSYLHNELEKSEYCLNPGSAADTKPFNLIVFVYEMLYGSDIINQYIESPQFNPIYAINNYAAEEEEEKEIEDKCCLICIDPQNGRWFDAVVIREFVNNDDDDKEYVQVQIISDSTMKYVWKYDDCIQYRNAKNELLFSYDIGEKCLYYLKVLKCWMPAKVDEIINVDVDDINIPLKMYRIRYDNNELCEIKATVVGTKLYKLKKKVPGSGIGENDDDDDDFMDIELDEEEGVLMLD